ncbi:sensor [Sphingomonas sp. DBB INV C78]
MNEDRDTIREHDAADWLARCRSGDLSDTDREAFETWKQVPSNASAFQALSTRYERLDDIAAEDPILRAREAALRRAGRRAGLQKLAMAASIAFAGLTGIGLFIGTFDGAPAPTEERFATRVGQGASATLADRSRVTLDADSEILVQFEQSARHVRLLRGRVYFEVAKDKSRPFVVLTRFASVRATGTAFSVSSRSDELDVVLREGSVRVAVDPRTIGRPAAPIDMQPDTKLTVGDGGWSLRHVPSDSALAWTQGFVVFDNRKLGDAIEELNAYSHRKIVIGPGLDERPISGTFRAGRQEDFARALSAYGIARIESNTVNRIILAAPTK